MQIYDDQLVVVTGGAGFIGSCVLRHLNDKGLRNLAVVDELGTSEKWKNLVGKQFIDIIPKHQLFDWLKGKEHLIRAFIHLGACSSTVEKDASYLLENNYRFTVNLAEYALQHNHRFIYASSAATYGDGAEGFRDSHHELQKLAPLNMYGYSKHLFDLWAAQKGILDKIVGLKYFNVFGPNEWHKGRMASTIMHVVPTAVKEGKIRLFKSNDPQFADGGQQRDFVYVKDVARMTCAFLENEAAGIFNIGTGKAETWNDLARAIFKALNLPENIEYIDMPADLKGKYQNYTCADMTKTRQALGSIAECQPLEKAVIDYVQNYLRPEKRW
ncbi:ADP-glyceromanno-heptose 6-epimerase [Parachlamydia sp. AcF125]|uniref:ADP-glyceromanno-heptose 6-epimerase n=1 Tax=Parachlamydia sp. AcF125 TaxID=2795736 RepID=UPI001BC8DA62|nr:ADP-glyceromanno-heptose 6-epimerase [Parachlamydia sp. AcF125]MBS4168482.1 ADP-L-glycero-D-manno-heptose-6-epimerase [Parachlamydia sp. AcF125]